jgi:hypothetical protein
MDVKVLSQLRRWCKLHNPRQLLPLRGTSLSPAYMVKKASNMATAEAVEDTCHKSTLVGTQQDEALEKDVAIQDIMDDSGGELTSGDKTAVVELFQQSPLTGCTTLMDMARESAGYFPNSKDPDKNNQSRYEKMIANMQSCPMFHYLEGETEELHCKESNWNNLIESIAKLFGDLPQKDIGKITESLLDLAETACSNVGQEQKTSLFVQDAFQVECQETRVIICKSDVTMRYDQGKGYTIAQTDYIIQRDEFQFYDQLWSSYAGMVADYHIKTFTQWLTDTDTTSSPGTNQIKFCWR